MSGASLGMPHLHKALWRHTPKAPICHLALSRTPCAIWGQVAPPGPLLGHHACLVTQQSAQVHREALPGHLEHPGAVGQEATCPVTQSARTGRKLLFL